jgi:hypothetical protein
MNDFLMKACVQYNDAVGTFAADLMDSMIGMERLLSEKNFDSNNYFPFYYSFDVGEPLMSSARQILFIIYSVKKDEVGDNYNSLIEFLNKNNNELPVYEYYFDLTAEEFLNLFKRLNITFSFLRKPDDYYLGTISKNTIKEIRL